jgi:hypothetical protein
MIPKTIDNYIREEQTTYDRMNQRISQTQRYLIIGAAIIGTTLAVHRCNTKQAIKEATPIYNIEITEPCIKAHNQHIDVTPCYQINKQDS